MTYALLLKLSHNSNFVDREVTAADSSALEIMSSNSSLLFSRFRHFFLFFSDIDQFFQSSLLLLKTVKSRVDSSSDFGCA